MIDKKLTHLIDIIFCLVLLPAMIMLLPIDRWIENNLLFVTLLLGWLYTIYWVHRKITIPYLFSDKKRFFVVAIIVVASIIITYFLAKYRLEGVPYRPHPHDRPPHDAILESKRLLKLEWKINNGANRMQQQAVWFMTFMVTTFSVVVSLLSELHNQMMIRQNVEFEKKKAELSLYKAQINPHFLFNTLNTLLGLVVTKSEKAEDAFTQFASMMRYMCTNSTQDYIPLSDELEYINQYIELQRYRLNDHTHINIDSDLHNLQNSYKIAPMLLITFVENAIKYGSSPSQESYIEISTSIRGNVLIFTTRNKIFTHSTAGEGIGIANCKKRLELLYPNQYTLIIDNNLDEYYVSLTIKLLKQ